MEDSNKLLEERVEAEPVRFNIILRDGSMIDCRAGREVYEGLFGARLEYVPRIVHNLNKGDYTVWEWVEREPAAVPDPLADYILGVELSRRIYLTD